MSDSTAMTVEFLRARLLSERSVSRTAKQRADQLAKRVVELEEQLRIVTNQRRKAEKAAVEVLSILEAQGLGEFSEVVDSSTDQEDVPGEQKGCEDTVKEDDSSTTSRMDRSEVDDALSESERVVSPKYGRNLSWKGNNNNQDSYGKKRIDHNRQRQRRSFLCTVDSSPRHPLGKSCRKNKRKEMGFLVQNGKDNSKLHDTQEKILPTHREDAVEMGFDDCLENSNEASANDNDSIDNLIKSSVDDRNTNPTQNGFSKEEEMEEALEKQAQFILLYQAEENSQREWEEKFNENNCPSTESSENGKMTEMSDDSRDPKGLSDRILCHEKNPNSSHALTDGYQLAVINDADQISHGSEAKISDSNGEMSDDSSDPKGLSDRILCHEKNPNSSHALTDGYQLAVINDADQISHGSEAKISDSNGEMPVTVSSGVASLLESTTSSANNHDVGSVRVLDQNQRSSCEVFLKAESSFQEFELSGQKTLCKSINGNQVQVQGLLGDKSDIVSSGCSNLNLTVNGTLESQCHDSRHSSQSSPTCSNDKLQDVPNQLSLQQFWPHKSGLIKVLESLQRAKLSLKQELSRSKIQNPNDSASYTDSHYWDARQIDTLGVPVGSAALFRLPTDVTPQLDLPRSTYYGSSSTLALPRHDIAFGESNQTLSSGLYPDSGVRISPNGVKDFGSQVTSDMVVMPSYTSMYSYPSPAMPTVFARDRYSILGLDRSSPDVRRT